MEVINLIRERFSPYDFTNKELTEQELTTLFTAAGKAASAYNEQPWRFIYALRQDKEAFNELYYSLAEGNRGWTEKAAALIITVVKTNYTKNDAPNGTAEHDLGLAVGNLTIQATAMGLHLHQMGGILPDVAIERLNIPEGYKPLTAIAVGYYEGENSFKPRKDVTEIAFNGKWS